MLHDTNLQYEHECNECKYLEKQVHSLEKHIAKELEHTHELYALLKEAKEAIEGAIRIKDLWILNDINTPPEHHGEALAVDSMLHEFQQVLSKIQRTV